MLRRHGDVKPGSPLGAFREEQALSLHRVSPSPFLSSSSSHTTQLQYTNSHPSLNFLQYCIDTLPTRNVVCPSGVWFENRPHLMPSIHLVQNLKHVIVQWVGIRPDRQRMCITNKLNMIFQNLHTYVSRIYKRLCIPSALLYHNISLFPETMN